jgi:hypothetical protein
VPYPNPATQFKKGWKGGPGRKPAKVVWVEAWEGISNQVVSRDAKNKPIKLPAAILRRLAKCALDGEEWAVKKMVDLGLLPHLIAMADQNTSTEPVRIRFGNYDPNRPPQNNNVGTDITGTPPSATPDSPKPV